MKSTIQEVIGKIRPGRKSRQALAMVGTEEQRQRIATAAYYKAAARSFVVGQEIDDWLQAESEFLNRESA